MLLFLYVGLISWVVYVFILVGFSHYWLLKWRLKFLLFWFSIFSLPLWPILTKRLLMQMIIPFIVSTIRLHPMILILNQQRLIQTTPINILLHRLFPIIINRLPPNITITIFLLHWTPQQTKPLLLYLIQPHISLSQLIL